jgi:radical SAM superfamily enzyme YgiQ (UPF0313 family)
MTLLLVNPPGIRPGRSGSFFTDQKRNLRPEQYRSMPMEHLGIMSMAAYARARGVPVRTVNGLVESHESVHETWRAMREAGRPTLVGFSIIDTIAEVVWLAERVRRHWPGVPVVLGNVMASLNYERVFAHYDCFDYVGLGDGEVAVTELYEAVASGARDTAVPGIASQDAGGKPVATPPKLHALDELPPPARDELPAVLEAGFSAAVYSTRGCPYRCTFCGTGAISDMLGKDSYRSRSVESVVDEIERLVRDFGIDHVSITDDLFLSKHPDMQARAHEFADEMLRRRVDVTFMIDARMDSVQDFSLYDKLYAAGLRRVFIGIETGSREQLIAYRKRSVRADEDAGEKLRALEDRGIEIVPGTIMFHPTVTPKELRETARLLRSLTYKTPRKFLDRITAYPGTPLHAEYEAKGLLTQDWPIGRWQFADPVAAHVHEEVRARIDGDPGITFDEAEHFFLERVDAWESAVTEKAALGSGEDS